MRGGLDSGPSGRDREAASTGPWRVPTEGQIELTGAAGRSFAIETEIRRLEGVGDDLFALRPAEVAEQGANGRMVVLQWSEKLRFGQRDLGSTPGDEAERPRQSQRQTRS